MRAWAHSVRVATGTIVITNVGIGLSSRLCSYSLRDQARTHQVSGKSRHVCDFSWHLESDHIQHGPINHHAHLWIVHRLTYSGSNRRVAPQRLSVAMSAAPVPSRRERTTDRQLIRIDISSCLFYFDCIAGLNPFYLYSSEADHMASDTLQLAKDDMISQLMGTLSITGASNKFLCVCVIKSIVS